MDKVLLHASKVDTQTVSLKIHNLLNRGRVRLSFALKHSTLIYGVAHRCTA
jgi:hypothetical protein